jgi:spore germination cell wall hydrolase CwlJ-like protein
MIGFTSMFASSMLVLSLALPRGAAPIDSATQRELTCLTEVVYFEAAEESAAGKLAVATVVMNRTESKHFPKTICGVVYQRGKKGCQFSWVCGHRIRRDPVLFAKAEDVARSALIDSVRLAPIKKAVYFHNVDVWPRWMQVELVRVAKIGRHIFYAFPQRSNHDAPSNTDQTTRRSSA